jgi:nucleoside-diphosphate-sugar epimerase
VKTNLITGGTGFIGRHLTRQLLARGEACRLLVRRTSDTNEFNRRADVELCVGDITDPDTLRCVTRDVRRVFHLAACGHVAAQSEEAYQMFVRMNVDGTRNVMRMCAGQGIEKFVHFSSTAAMGLIRKAITDESDRPEPVTPYQRSKLASERAALELAVELGISTVIVRPCMVYGIGGHGEFRKISTLMRRGLFPRLGRGRNLTPLVHVRDVVQGAIKAAERGRAGEVYLLTSARSLELDRMRELVMAAWDQQAVYPYFPVSAMYAVAAFFEWWARLRGTTPVVTRRNIASTVWDREFSIDKARRDLGYEPTVSFEQGIAETIKWFKEYGAQPDNSAV